MNIYELKGDDVMNISLLYKQFYQSDRPVRLEVSFEIMLRKCDLRSLIEQLARKSKRV